MRVNHVGEVCAQALYTAQALTTRNPALRAHFTQACIEETDHLAWTAQRLDELNARPSVLNPLWYAGAFGLGLLAGRLGDKVSLGFVTALQDSYALRKTNNSASVGVGAIGSVSLPFSSSSESLVKVGSETIAKDTFYDSFFDLVKRYLVIDQALAD